MAGLWCMSIGYGRDEVVDAVAVIPPARICVGTAQVAGRSTTAVSATKVTLHS